MSEKPTIVLVHGAFADASGWGGVMSQLQSKGYTVYAPANPLRGVAADAEYIRTFVGTLDGPVILAGHSYGGTVITNAAVGADNVKALAYVAAFAPQEGETGAEAGNLAGPGPDLTSIAVFRPYPGAGEGDAEATLNPDIFPQAFCQDLPEDLARTMAYSQRAAALKSLVEPSGPPAWKTLPSWYMIATEDRVIPPAAERIMAERAGSTISEVPSSHVAMITHPAEVAAMIVAADEATQA